MSLSILLSSTCAGSTAVPGSLKTMSFRYLQVTPTHLLLSLKIHGLELYIEHVRSFFNFGPFSTWNCLSLLNAWVAFALHLFSPEVKKLALHLEQSGGAFPPTRGSRILQGDGGPWRFIWILNFMSAHQTRSGNFNQRRRSPLLTCRLAKKKASS